MRNTEEDPLTIPAFLRQSSEERAESWRRIPPAPSQPMLVTPSRGAYPKHWYEDPGTRTMILAEEAKKMRKADKDVRYQLFWKPNENEKWHFVGYHDGPHPDADLGAEHGLGDHVLCVLGGTKPEVDHPVDGPSFDTLTPMPRQSGRKATQVAGQGEREARQPRERKARGAGRVPTGMVGTLRATKKKPDYREGSGRASRAALLLSCVGKSAAEYFAVGGDKRMLEHALEEGWAALEKA